MTTNQIIVHAYSQLKETSIRVLSVGVFFAEGGHLNNRVFLSRNYELLAAPLKFDVLKHVKTNFAQEAKLHRQIC